MSATDQMRAMLAELMGSDAMDPGQKKDRPHYTDRRVCRPYLLNCCQHDALASTRMDLGECPKIHDPALRADFEREQAMRDHFYDLDALEELNFFLDETDRRMEIAKKKLEETQVDLGEDVRQKVSVILVRAMTAQADAILVINEELGKLLAIAEQLGANGQVDESLKLMQTIEDIKARKMVAEVSTLCYCVHAFVQQEYRAIVPASALQQQKLRVCDDCGAYLGIHDNDRRLADHFGGKLHMGFVFLREKRQEFQLCADERRKLKRENGVVDVPAAVVASTSSRSARSPPAQRRERTKRSRSRSHERKRSRSRSKHSSSRKRHSPSPSSRKHRRSRSRERSSRDRTSSRYSDDRGKDSKRDDGKSRRSRRSTSKDNDTATRRTTTDDRVDDKTVEKDRNGVADKSGGREQLPAFAST